MLAEGVHPDDIVKEEHYVDVEDLMQKKMEAMKIANRNQSRRPISSTQKNVVKVHPSEFPMSSSTNEGMVNQIEFTPFVDAQAKKLLNAREEELEEVHPYARTGEVPLLLAQDDEDQEANYVPQIVIDHEDGVDDQEARDINFFQSRQPLSQDLEGGQTIQSKISLSSERNQD